LISKENDSSLILNIENRLRKLNIFKPNEQKNFQDKNREVNLYEMFTFKSTSPSKTPDKVNNSSHPFKRNKFDDLFSKSSQKDDNIVSRLNINAEEYVPRRRKVSIV
jgi:hypothetical protein